MAKIQKHVYQFRRGAAQEWANVNPILRQGEPGFEYDTGKLKIGNGLDSWLNLPYLSGNNEDIITVNYYFELPRIGDSSKIYRVVDNKTLYQWNSPLKTYEVLGATGSIDPTQIPLIDGGHADSVSATKIILRNDTIDNWNNNATLEVGEVGIELQGNKAKLKVGVEPHQLFSEAPYIGGSETQHFEVSDLSTIPIERLAIGDTAVVKIAIDNIHYSYTAYVWNGLQWSAMDGNYNADNIYFSKDMMVTTDIGYITTTNGSGTIPSAGKNLTEVFEAMFVKAMEPDNNTAPYVTLSAKNNKIYEVGTTVVPEYNAIFNAGIYEYGPSTGVELIDWEVTNGKDTKVTAAGIFDSIIVDDNTEYIITAKASHSAGVIPNTNKGIPSTVVSGFAAGTKSATSAPIKGYRSYFYGAVNKAPEELTSADIRALTNGGNYNGSKTIEIKANGQSDLKAFIVAIPSTNTRSGITKVDSTAGMTVNVTSQYNLSSLEPEVSDARGENYNPLKYKLWVWVPAEIDPGTVHKITLG